LSVLDTTPNVDYFTREEIKTMVKSFKEQVASGDLNDVSDDQLAMSPSYLTLFCLSIAVLEKQLHAQ